MNLVKIFQPAKPVSSAKNINRHQPGKGSITQRIRLWAGLVLMAFVTLHLINHALGNVSIDSMNTMQQWRIWVWRSMPGSILLFGALIVHLALALWKLISRKSLRLPLWEWSQIVLGLSIPYLLLTHILIMRGTLEALEINVDYPLALRLIWPGAGLSQSFLLVATWTHGCIGLHFWLRFNDWYAKYKMWGMAVAVLIPSLALTGWLNAAKENHTNLLILNSEDPDAAEIKIDTVRYIFGELLPAVELGRNTVIGVGVALLLVIIGIQVLLRFKKNIKVDYGDGKLVTSAPGMTILEISRQAGIPHMSVCGGRARCSTCRTLIIQGSEHVQAKTKAEAELLEKLNAENSIRLACQAKITGNVTLRPLVQPQDRQLSAKSGDPLGWGVEREIAVLFLDIRGFSRISEKSLPYDVVFILNSFFGEVSSAIEANNGYVDKFMGDGMMALFGLESSSVEASRDALRAAVDCEKAARNVSRILTQHLAEPIKIGVGVHIGEAVIGRIGKTNDQEGTSRLTAIGDSVNISARLEQATKEFSTSLVFSTKTGEIAGLKDLEQYGVKTQIKVRNISRPVEILAVDDLPTLERALS